ncbi:MAG: anaerobic ribonucleoside-triphosphate reductase activating protein [Candidatus Diapherotrites archaeon]
MDVKGTQWTSLIDFPDHVATVIFLPGCNFQCGFCYNVELVKSPETLPSMDETLLFTELERRKKLIEGVSITGGEPTLQTDLPEFISKIRELGLLIKLDTNGTNPKMLQKLIEKKQLDFIAMDIKSSRERYEEAAGCKVDLSAIEKSIELIKNSGIDYEFRSTVHPKIYSKEDALRIGEWLKGARKYVLQQFKPMKGTINPEFEKVKAYSKSELEEMAESLKPFFGKVEIRNV